MRTRSLRWSELEMAPRSLFIFWELKACGRSEEKIFQAIQRAYSVLSDTNKRFLYDVGVYDSDDDDDENDMGEFLNEMASMMSQNKQNDNRNVSFEELQQLFEDIFHNDSNSSSLSHSGPHTSL